MISDILAFLASKARIVFIIISLAVLVEGSLYLFFPRRMKKVIQECPIFVFRIAGVAIMAIGIILLFVLIEILRFRGI